MTSKLAVGTVVSLFAASTTGVLHWVSKNYVRRLLVDEAAGMVTAETTTLLGQVASHTFPISDIVGGFLFVEFSLCLPATYRQLLTPAAGVFVTFTVNGRGFFVHEELVGDKSPALRRALGKGE